MPSAWTGQDGSWSIGYSHDKPYSTLWTSVTLFPALQMSGRYVGISGIQGFGQGHAGANTYGRYKDKVFDAKLQLVEEGEYWPALAIGRTDLFGTGLFRSDYVALGKHFGPLETTVGYGTGLIDGAFAGARWTLPDAPRWALVAEYDARDYRQDFRAEETFAGERASGLKAGVEYRWGWLSLQAAHQKSHAAINAMVTIPLNEREFVPKIYEPAPFQPKELPARPTAQQWHVDPHYARALQQALHRQDYTLVSLAYRRDTLSLNLSNSRISDMGRAVGRAVRTAMYFMPLETRTIKVTYSEQDMPVGSYEFFDMQALSDYLTGKIDRHRFKEYVLVRPAGPEDRIRHDSTGALAAGLSDDNGLAVLLSEDGDLVQLKQQDSLLNRFKLAPRLGFYFNDPSGALKYELGVAANLDRRIANGLYFNSQVAATLLEDVSDVTQPSNSLLPHVRTDIAEYKRGGKVKLNKAVLNQYFKPAGQWYGRVSAGLYEEMFAGAGGQLLYAPFDRRWAADVTVDALRQRDFQGWLGMRDYDTVSAIASLHYRLPYETTATLRAGRFLAKDNGARFEIKRRFRSGFEIGGWYTYTDGQDITSPGSPASPYRDKGIFFRMSLDALLPQDSRSRANFAISPWTRDVGQMVNSPGDLYPMVESGEWTLHQSDGLGNFSERADEANHPAVARPIERVTPGPNVRLRLEDSSHAFPPLSELGTTLLGAGAIVGLASLADERWKDLVAENRNNRLVKGWDKLGKAAPLLAVGGAGMALALGDSKLQNTGLIALQAATVSAGGSMLLKQVFNRARPEQNAGHWGHQPSDRSRSDSSFPSNHAAVTFAAITPFAAEYRAPWLYGVAAAASLGRTAGNKHWLSDVAAGGILGYFTGKWLWSAQRERERYPAMLDLGPGYAGVKLNHRY
ncbi:phosphatase PAP2 family protein [Crenobacter intestini]|uniref:Phosphatase PAP2 family protein n=2 Tax=Crenobacter intestini TaxID=2563443 RepID=A0A4T0UIZ4_9NEIS|nr:phosphatase PAP2 family protein [Crenobacter intestini]